MKNSVAKIKKGSLFMAHGVYFQKSAFHTEHIMAIQGQLMVNHDVSSLQIDICLETCLLTEG